MHALIPAVMLLLAAGAARGEGLDILYGGRCQHLALSSGHFALTYRHSMYDQPFTERYVVAGSELVLEQVESRSAAVLEYFDITAPGPVHAQNRHLAELVMRIAMGEPQVLHLDGISHTLREFGQPGDRIVLRAAVKTLCTRENDG